MEKYKGLENGGVIAYETFEDGIILKFKDGRSYLYDYEKPGKKHVEEMKRLAVEGSGLTTYINQEVRENYSGKIKDFYGKLKGAFGDGLEYQKKVRNDWQ